MHAVRPINTAPMQKAVQAGLTRPGDMDKQGGISRKGHARGLAPHHQLAWLQPKMVSLRRLEQASARTPTQDSGTLRHQDMSSSSRLSLQNKVQAQQVFTPNPQADAHTLWAGTDTTQQLHVICPQPGKR